MAENSLSCRSCGQPRPEDSDDPLCSACREQVAAWHSEQRLTDLANQGFREAAGMAPPSGLYAGLPDDAGLRARQWGQGASQAPQQVTGWTAEHGAMIEYPGNDYAVIPGQVRCRHCAAPLTAGQDGSWADPLGSAACFEDVPHAPMPGDLDGNAGSTGE